MRKISLIGRLAGFAALTALLAGPVALSQTRVSPEALFAGARLGMAKSELEALPVFGSKGAGCGRLVLPDQPRTRVEQCAGEEGLATTPEGVKVSYLLAPDQEGQLRVIHIAVSGGPQSADFAIDTLFRRFGVPLVANNVRSPESIDRVSTRLNMGWIFGAQRLEFSRPCRGAGNFCVNYSDRPYARQIARSVTTDRPRADNR